MATITETEATDLYNEMLDEQGMIKIGSLEYYPSTVLEEVDPTAYRVGFTEFCDYLADSNTYVEGYTEEVE